MNTEIEKKAVSARALVAGACGFLVLTMLLGLLLRSEMVTGALSRAGLVFVHLRHAHSHAGFYGALTLAWWWVERRGGLALGRRFVAAYAAAAALATAGFAAMGYKAPTIVLSTFVAGGWLYVGWRHRRRARAGERAWLDAAPPVLVAAVALVPIIAVTARRDFAFSRALAHVFIGVALLGVFLPASLQARGHARRLPVGLYVLLAGAAAWAIVFGGALDETWRIAGLHGLILGPVAIGFVPPAARAAVPRALRWGYAVALAVMLAVIVAPAWLWPWPPAVAVLAASGVFVSVAVGCVFFVLCRGGWAHEERSR